MRVGFDFLRWVQKRVKNPPSASGSSVVTNKVVYPFSVLAELILRITGLILRIGGETFRGRFFLRGSGMSAVVKDRLLAAGMDAEKVERLQAASLRCLFDIVTMHPRRLKAYNMAGEQVCIWPAGSYGSY